MENCRRDELFILQGKSGVTPIARFDTSEFSTRFAGEIKELDVEGFVSKKNARRLDDTIKYILVAGKQVPLSPRHALLNLCLGQQGQTATLKEGIHLPEFPRMLQHLTVLFFSSQI